MTKVIVFDENGVRLHYLVRFAKRGKLYKKFTRDGGLKLNDKGESRGATLPNLHSRGAPVSHLVTPAMMIRAGPSFETSGGVGEGTNQELTISSSYNPPPCRLPCMVDIISLNIKAKSEYS